jgi:hypothetical protein
MHTIFVKKNTVIFKSFHETFNNILKDGVTSALRMMCVDMLWAVAFSGEYT